jgi:hypothetical protein
MLDCGGTQQVADAHGDALRLMYTVHKRPTLPPAPCQLMDGLSPETYWFALYR